MYAHTKALFHLGFLLALVLAVGLLVIKTPALTGAAVQETEERKTYAHTLNDRITRFFGVYAIDFPRGTCTSILEELFTDIVFDITEVTRGYSTTGKERIATLNFGIQQSETLGTIDMIKGASLTGDEKTEGYITMTSQSYIRVPKKQRLTFFSIGILGTLDQLFRVTKGSFSTPALDCTFTTNDGVADCSCSMHPIKGELMGVFTD